MTGYKLQIKEACGEKDYDMLKDDIYDAIEQAKRFVAVPVSCCMLALKVLTITSSQELKQLVQTFV